MVYTEYGTVALGSILAAVAAGLESQLVEAKRLMSMPPDDDDDGGDDADHRPSTLAAPVASSAGAIPDAKVDNVWMATVSGTDQVTLTDDRPRSIARLILSLIFDRRTSGDGHQPGADLRGPDVPRGLGLLGRHQPAPGLLRQAPPEQLRLHQGRGRRRRRW